jgi:hypothetical protein
MIRRVLAMLLLALTLVACGGSGASPSAVGSLAPGGGSSPFPSVPPMASPSGPDDSGMPGASGLDASPEGSDGSGASPSSS